MSVACDLWTSDGPCAGKLRKVNTKVYMARRCDKCGNHSYGHLSLQQLLDNQKFNLDLQDEYLERVDEEEERKAIAALACAARTETDKIESARDFTKSMAVGGAAGVALKKNATTPPDEMHVQRQKMLADKEATVVYFRKAVHVLCVLPSAAEARAYNLRKIAVLRGLHRYDISKKLNALFACGLPEVVRKLAVRCNDGENDDEEVMAALHIEATQLVGMWRAVIRENGHVMSLLVRAGAGAAGASPTAEREGPLANKSRLVGPCAPISVD